MPKCDFNIVALHLHGCSPVNLLHIFRTSFPKYTSGWLLLKISYFRRQNSILMMLWYLLEIIWNKCACGWIFTLDYYFLTFFGRKWCTPSNSYHEKNIYNCGKRIFKIKERILNLTHTLLKYTLTFFELCTLNIFRFSSFKIRIS